MEKLSFNDVRAVADDNGIDLRLVTVTFVKSRFCGFDELVAKVFLDEVDGAAAEAATHNTRAGHAAFASNVVEEVEFLAANLVVVRQSAMGFVHHASDGMARLC